MEWRFMQFTEKSKWESRAISVRHHFNLVSWWNDVCPSHKMRTQGELHDRKIPLWNNPDSSSFIQWFFNSMMIHWRQSCRPGTFGNIQRHFLLLCWGALLAWSGHSPGILLKTLQTNAEQPHSPSSPATTKVAWPQVSTALPVSNPAVTQSLRQIRNAHHGEIFRNV